MKFLKIFLLIIVLAICSQNTSYASTTPFDNANPPTPTPTPSFLISNFASSSFFKYISKLFGGEGSTIVGNASFISQHLCRTYPAIESTAPDTAHCDDPSEQGNLFDRLVPKAFDIGQYNIAMRPSDSSHPLGRYVCTDLVIDSYNATYDPSFQTKSNGVGMSDDLGCISSTYGMVYFMKNNPSKGYFYYDFYNNGNDNDKNVLQKIVAGDAIFFTGSDHQCGGQVKSISGADYIHTGVIKDITWTDKTIGKGTLTTYEANAYNRSGTYQINNWRFTDTAVGGFGGRGG